MSEPKRYTAHDEYVFYDDDGEFVSYKEYAALRAQLTTAERERDEARREREAMKQMVDLQDVWEGEAIHDITTLVTERNELRHRAERMERVVEAARAWANANAYGVEGTALVAVLRALDADAPGDA